jgi:RHS repeat-associated protein
LEYFAFGETFVQEHSNTDRIPYLFNGKELDAETGLYYYGARYYDPRTSTWPSVDPMGEKMPGWSPYNYALDNPVKFIDPDGKKPQGGGGK